MSLRPVKRLVISKPTLEGAGVHLLRRAFGFGNTSDFDRFLLLDDFRNDVPEDYLLAFHGTHTEESRLLHMSSPERLSTAPAWETMARSLPVISSG